MATTNNTKKFQTIHHSSLIEEEVATNLYNYLEKNIPWVNGIPSRILGFTRKAFPVTDLSRYPFLAEAIRVAIMNMMPGNVVCHGIYLNYYRNGEDYTPQHSHKDTKQLIISLGATRTLKVASKNYSMKNGDVIVFGSSIHGIPKEPEVKEGRISIAVFLQ